MVVGFIAVVEFTVAFTVAVASPVAVVVTVTAGCNVVGFVSSTDALTTCAMIARRSLSSIFPSNAVIPWRIQFLYSTGFFSSIFERFAALVGVIVVDFFLL